ncbi:hypothetical protein K470DRAFT_221917 [Piedraia hortae CBS 480.64]|uniref:SH3 domain-containing protein n=1 Tax=Piedraia hortae CBS 480.64 TaxID=1314780 RepID=A0A6A7BST0_9PEZI|nr:hypothetical protein K470DRAFT_221917 [Piedraia hortae CBS 480.64]
MPWKPLPSVAFAICTYPFKADGPDDLPLQIGDCLYLVEQGGKDGEWCRGYLVGFPSILAGLKNAPSRRQDAQIYTGIFPRNCVQVREVIGAAGSTAPIGPRVGQENSYDPQTRRKAQAQHAWRLSRALSRRVSLGSKNQSRQSLVSKEAPPRPAGAPKPPAPVPLLRVGDETSNSSKEPLIDEIASCLREWHDAHLHNVLLTRSYVQLSKIQDLVKRVDQSRKQLMHDVLTAKELAKLREETVWNLVAGNKMMGEEVIVRSSEVKGRILTANDSLIEMTKLQANMSILERSPLPPVDLHMLYHVLVDIRSLICDYEPPATLYLHLCTKEPGEPLRRLTESYAISLPMVESSRHEQSKCLFADLSAQDIGIGAGTNSLYVVFKLNAEQPVRSRANSLSTTRPRMGSSSGTIKHGSVRGRRGVFGGPRKKDSHDLSKQSSFSRVELVDGNQSSQTQFTELKEGRTVKRLVGVGAFEIGKVARDQTEGDRSVTMWVPSAMNDGNSDDEDWEVIRDLSGSASGYFSRVSAVKRFDVYATAFASSDLDALVRSEPTKLLGVPRTPKLDFSGVPSKKRSDIYLTLTEPVFPPDAALSHSKLGPIPLISRCPEFLANLQLTLEVRNASGQRINDCIFTASNHDAHTAWRTTAVEMGERWNQTIKLSVPAQDVPGCHIVMSIADAPNFPFALAWVPFWENGAFVRDGSHQVVLYLYDEHSSSTVDGKGAYLSLPPWQRKTESGQVNVTTISLQTFLCSTEYSQDPTLLGLLRWRYAPPTKLLELLERFPFIPEIELVKLLSDVFAALFEILHDYANSSGYEGLIFHCFVILLGIAKDRRFNVDNVIDRYALTRHEWPYASECLMRAYQRLLSNPMDPGNSRKLRATLKVGDQMLKLIIDTRKEPPKKEKVNATHERHATFSKDLGNLFVALMALMRNPMPVLLGTQTLVVQHFHTWLPELQSIMKPSEILEIATDLLDACAHANGMMALYRIILIFNYSHLDVFKLPEVHQTFMTNTVKWLSPYWGHEAAVTEQWRNQVRLCCSVVVAQMDGLNSELRQYVPAMIESYFILQRAKREPKSSFSLLFPSNFPFQTRPTQSALHTDEAMLELSALIAAALVMPGKLSFPGDTSAVLEQALKFWQSVLSCEAVPKKWLSLYVSHHRFAMRSLERISSILIDALPDVVAPNAAEAIEFDTPIWRTFFDTLFAVICSPTMALESFPEQKRRAVWKIAGDVREDGARLLQRTWSAIGWQTEEDEVKLHGFERLGGYQVQFVPELVPPVVELCLSVHASLREVAIEVLRSMIISTWEIDQDLGIIQTAIIDCLDRICRAKPVTETYLHGALVTEVYNRFRPLKNTGWNDLYVAVGDMLGKISELLGRLVTVHHGEVDEASQIVETLQLLELLKDVQSNEAYVRHVHRLTSLNAAAGYLAEAGLALRLHANHYPWDPLMSLTELNDPKMPAQTAFERKEALYFEMCRYFERGQCWQRALETYHELAAQYEHNVFDFAKLARCQRAIAGVYERIARGEARNPRYFRVLFQGSGFSTSLRDKQFIYEGLPQDRMSSFEEKLLQQYPQAQIARGRLDPGAEGQFLQVSAVNPNKDLEHVVYQRTKVTQAIREHALLSAPQKFSITTRHPAHNVPLTEQEVEKIIYTTAEPFPVFLRRSEITHMETITLSPIQAAIERATRKTQELLALERRIIKGEDESGAREILTNDLMFSVDPHSESSVARYRGLLKSTSDSIEYDPMRKALHIALLDHTLAIKRCLSLYSRSAYLATQAELLPRFTSTYEPEIAILFPKTGVILGQPEIEEPSLIDVSTQHISSHSHIPGENTEERETEPPRGRKRPSISGLRSRSGSHRRSESRTRERSLVKRLSFLRLQDDDKQARDAGGEEGRSWNKRLSILRNGVIG